MYNIRNNYLNALKYYAGQADAYPGAPVDKKAYNTLNVLFYDDTVSERVRAREGKTLNPDFITNDAIIPALCSDLINAAINGGVGAKAQTVYRVARLVDVEAMKRNGQLLSFTSTSRNGFLDAYTNKDSLVLLELSLPANAPRADLASLIPDYAKQEEAEVLLPPWLPIILEECALSEAELHITDCYGNPPIAKYRGQVGETFNPPEFEAYWSCEDLPATEAGIRVLEALMRGEEPALSDEKDYIAWKQRLRRKIVLETFYHSLPDIFRDSIDSVCYITGNLLDDVFDAKRDRTWIKALLGVNYSSELSGRIDQMPDERVVHTVTTFLLGSWLRDKLLLGFNALPRIFSKNNRVGDPFPFFWTITCLGHDVGYYYENIGYKNEKGIDRFSLFSSLYREAPDHYTELRKLLGIGDEKTLLELERGDLEFYGLSEEECDWAARAIRLARHYYRYRLDPGDKVLSLPSLDQKTFEDKCCSGEFHGCIDHGIVGGVVMFDALRRMYGKPCMRKTSARHIEAGESGFAAANHQKSRFLACSILVSLSIARHNMWVTNKCKPNDDKCNPLNYYSNAGLEELMVDGDKNKIRFDDPLDQLLYFLDYMDTIDPVKAFYLRSLDRKRYHPDSEDPDLWIDYLKHHVRVLLCRGEIDKSHLIRFQFLPVPKDTIIAPDGSIKTFFDRGVGEMGNWLVLKECSQKTASQVNMYLPVITCKNSAGYPFGVTDQELLDLLFYQGVPDSSRPGSFFRLPNAYQTFNLLMMTGLEGEKTRIGTEGQRPDSIYIRCWEQTVEVFRNVFSALCKCLVNSEDFPRVLHRMDRWENAKQMRESGQTIAFTSTTKAELLPAFLEGKDHPVIEQVELTKRIPIFDYQQVLKDDYAFAEEEEVLLPPFVKLDIPYDLPEKAHLNEKILHLKIKLGGMDFSLKSEGASFSCEEESYLEQLLENYREEAADILEHFVKDKDFANAPVEKECEAYILWKSAFQSLIRQEFQRLYANNLKENRTTP